MSNYWSVGPSYWFTGSRSKSSRSASLIYLINFEILRAITNPVTN